MDIIELLKKHEQYKSIVDRAESELKALKSEINNYYMANSNGIDSIKVKLDTETIQIKQVSKNYTKCDIKALEILYPEAHSRTVTTSTTNYLDIRKVKR